VSHRRVVILLAVPQVAIIVALHRLTPEARQCIETILMLNDPRAELIIACDRRPEGLPAGARVVETRTSGDTSPAEKRDAALATTDASICAFIDDDAYPAADWLERALGRFDADETLHGLGGPGVTPPRSPFRRRLAGAFYESRFGSGGLRNRFVPTEPQRDVDDWPAYNFFVRTDALRNVGGWNSRYYGGEDTKLCLALHDAGYRIDYDPQVLVYHHRRPVFGPLMRQTGNVGRRRGSFVRRYPTTSRRAIYFAPTVVLLAAPIALLATIRSHRGPRACVIALLVWAAVGAAARSDGADIDESVALPLALAAGHGAYGWGFLWGLLESPTVEET
jgi:Glycosyl transferase family group 2